MNRKSLILALACFFMLTVLVAGCGGGESGGDPGGGSGDNSSDGGNTQESSGAGQTSSGAGQTSSGAGQTSSGAGQTNSGAGQTDTQTKIATGNVAKVRTESGAMRLIVRSTTGGDEPQRMIFAVTENATITLNGQDATLEDAKKGQQAQIKYFVKNDRSRAQEIVLFGSEGSSGNATTN